MRIALMVFTVGLLAGCTTAKQIALPNGDRGYLVSCNTGAQDIGDCYNKASGLCHGPYEVIDRIEGSQVNYSAKPFTSSGGMMPRRDIMIQCNS